MSGVERDPGIWVSRGVDTHRSARLIAPVYLGPHCRVYEDVVLGPNTVVSACSLIDRNTRIEASLIAEDSMIGEGLTLNRMVVTQGLVLDARTEDAVYVADIPSLADPRQPGQLRRFAESAVALVLLVLLLPISLIAYIYFALLRGVAIVTTQCVRLPQASRASTGSFALAGFGADAWSHTLPAGWEAFLRQFLPGLPAVFLGRLSLVGLPPVTPQQMEALPGEWQSIYLAGRPGLISEASVSAANADDQAQRYVADACYEAQRTPLHDARLMARYFAALILPR